jgi:hypothetical protein
MKYPVRCCCQPQKILGYLELPDWLKPGSRWVLMVDDRKTGRALSAAAWTPADPVGPTFRGLPVRLEAVVMQYRDLESDVDELAVYSDDRPIEFWRIIHGFEEMVAGAGVAPA